MDISIRNYKNGTTLKNKALNLNQNSDAKSLLTYVQQNSTASVLNDGIKLYENQDYASAMTRFNEVLKKEPNNAYAYYYRALIYDEQKKTQLAINDYLSVIKNTKDLPIANYMLAIDYDSIENYKDAFKYYSSFISSYATDDEYLKYAKTRLEELRPYAS